MLEKTKNQRVHEQKYSQSQEIEKFLSSAESLIKQHAGHESLQRLTVEIPPYMFDYLPDTAIDSAPEDAPLDANIINKYRLILLNNNLFQLREVQKKLYADLDAKQTKAYLDTGKQLVKNTYELLDKIDTMRRQNNIKLEVNKILDYYS